MDLSAAAARAAAAPLWRPSPEAVSRTAMFRLAETAGCVGPGGAVDYRRLHAWSVAAPDAFWSLMWDSLGVIGTKGERIYVPGAEFRTAQFFPDARLNYAQNLLRTTGAGDAIVFESEDKARLRLSHDALRERVSRLQQALKAAGVGVGDRVAGVLPNIPDALAIMLAAASLGAVWCSVSPDFGARGVVDRLAQIEAKILFVCDSYWYGGKRHATRPKLADILPGLPTITACVVVPHAGGIGEIVAQPGGILTLATTYFYQNEARDGSGVYNNGGSVTVTV